MHIDKYKAVARFMSEDGDELTVRYTNRGEPYREGIQVELWDKTQESTPYLFLEKHEAEELRDLLNTLYPK